ncbi:MAG TPA: lytic transglycosylase domain-containing protein [Chthoniobacteraceae bacterium]|jgi:soluble lytic murein transglycosylase
MIRFLRISALVLVFAALCAASVLLWLSPDPYYAIQEWMHGSRFYSYDSLIVAAGKKYGVDPMLIKAIVWRESAFQPDKKGTSGERGLMQVGEAAARDWAHSEKIETFVPTDLFDPKTNLDAGVWYLRKALERAKGRDDAVPFALAEYNAGRRRVEGWLAKTQLNDAATAYDLERAIDFPSTRQYIEDITERRRFYQKRGRL